METTAISTDITAELSADVSTGSPAAGMLAALERKVLSGDTPDRGDWERFQIGLLKKNMEIADSTTASARVKADAVGKMLWAVQMNLERNQREAELEKKQTHDFDRMERQVEISAALTNHRDWRREGRDKLYRAWERGGPLDPSRVNFAVPVPSYEPVDTWPLGEGDPPRPGEHYQPRAVPDWVTEKRLGRPLELDDLPDEVYWYGNRSRLGPSYRRKDPLFRVTKWDSRGRGVEYVKTERGKKEFPKLGREDLDPPYPVRMRQVDAPPPVTTPGA